MDVCTARLWDTGWGLDAQALVSLMGWIDPIEKKRIGDKGSARLPTARGQSTFGGAGCITVLGGTMQRWDGEAGQ